MQRGQMPLGEVPELRAESPRVTVHVPPDHEELVEDLAPRVRFHSVAYVSLVEVRFDAGQAVVGDAEGLRRESRPFGVPSKRVGGRGESVVFGQAVGFREDEDSPLRLGGGADAQRHVVGLVTEQQSVVRPELSLEQ